jgi:hypothetical protein
MAAWYPDSHGLDEKSWELKSRPALFQITNAPLHARHMEPNCSAHEDWLHERKSRIPGNVANLNVRRGSKLESVDMAASPNTAPGETDFETSPEADKSPRHPLLALYVSLYALSPSNIYPRKLTGQS